MAKQHYMLKPALNASVFLHALSCVCQLASLANSADIKHIFITTITQLFVWWVFGRNSFSSTANRSDGYFEVVTAFRKGSVPVGGKVA